jgi:hypothetical protein
MSVKKAVFGILLAAFATQAVADIPDGKGGRTSPQAGKQTATTAVMHRCCDKTISEAKGVETRVPPQRTMVVTPTLACRHHMPEATGGVATRVPPQRAAVAPAAAVHHACCESARCHAHVG